MMHFLSFFKRSAMVAVFFTVAALGHAATYSEVVRTGNAHPDFELIQGIPTLPGLAGDEAPAAPVVPTQTGGGWGSWFYNVGAAVVNAATSVVNLSWINWGTATPAAVTLTAQQAFLQNPHALATAHPFDGITDQRLLNELVILRGQLNACLIAYLQNVQKKVNEALNSEHPVDANNAEAMGNILLQSMYFGEAEPANSDDSAGYNAYAAIMRELNAMMAVVTQSGAMQSSTAYAAVYQFALYVFNLINPMGENNVRLSDDWTREQYDFERQYPATYEAWQEIQVQSPAMPFDDSAENEEEGAPSSQISGDGVTLTFAASRVALMQSIGGPWQTVEKKKKYRKGGKGKKKKQESKQ